MDLIWFYLIYGNSTYYTFIKIGMSKIEELVYNAHEYGQRTQLLKKASEIRNRNPNMVLEEVYEKAYACVMKTK